MKTYSTTLYLEVEAENEEEAIEKMYDSICSGKVQINSLMEEEKPRNSDEINFLDLIDWNQFKQTTKIRK